MGASALKLDDPKSVVERWNPDEPAQFFWIDDAFGVTQYESYLVAGWNHVLPQVKTLLRKGGKIVMTSRDYIYNRARSDLKEGSFPLFKESQVVIDVCDLSLEERQQILYNHIKLGNQARSFRTAIKPHLDVIASHQRFAPETARRLADPFFTQGLEIDRFSLGNFVEKQERLLREVITGLDEHSKAALALIYMRSDALQSPVVLESSEREALERLGSHLGACITALGSLEGSMVRYVRAEGVPFWKFKHPTIGDAFAALLLENPELLGIYVHGTPIDRLMVQLTCGDVGLERAVALPADFFPLVLRRLDEVSTTGRFKSDYLQAWLARAEVYRFLAYRCSKEFLSLYIAEHPLTLEDVSEPGLSLSAASEIDVAARLHEFGLLPEDNRQKFVETVCSYALAGEDVYALESDRIQSVFTQTELNELRTRVRRELIPKLADVRSSLQFSYFSDSDPEEHMQPFIDSLSTLEQEFSDDDSIIDLINREQSLAEEWISEHRPDDNDNESQKRRSFGDVDATTQSSPQARTIFDDIDE